MFRVARWLRQRTLRRNDFDLTAARRQSIPENSRAVASTKGSSTGGVAGDGPMAVAGRAPMLPVDYSFLWARLLFRVSHQPAELPTSAD